MADGSAGVEFVEVVLGLLSYIAPVWTTLFAFYISSRHLYDTTHDVTLTQEVRASVDDGAPPDW